LPFNTGEWFTRKMSEDPLICIIEIPKGSRNKYEYDPDLGGIKLDRFVSASVVYPTDYGYVPNTLAPDGDPLDVLVCVSEPTFPGCIVPTKIVGLFKMADEKGPDDHVVCVPVDDPGWNSLEDVDDLPAQLRAEIGHFFEVYKDLDADRHSEVGGWDDRKAALETIRRAREEYRARQR
jgi:inorganic pyrophosphatase